MDYIAQLLDFSFLLLLLLWNQTFSVFFSQRWGLVHWNSSNEKGKLVGWGRTVIANLFLLSLLITRREKEEERRSSNR